MLTPFRSFLQGGFECSCHRMPDGRRLDLLDSTGHARHAAQDYAALAGHGLHTVRDGMRWHRIGCVPGRYDWSSLLPMLRAAGAHGTQVIWDLCHYGWPQWLDIWSPRFVDEFGRFAAAAAQVVRDELPGVPFYCPVNEISYWSWAGGEVQHFGPTTSGRGEELKRQLVRATLRAIDAIAEVDGRARFVLADPAIHVHAVDDATQDAAAALSATQFQAWDMICGMVEPELGGEPRYLDIVGVNYYPHNQWLFAGPTVSRHDPRYRPLREMLLQIARRYDRTVLLSETGAEGADRAPWLRYVADEVAHAQQAGAQVAGICLYPVTDYPGWGDDRHCPTGLLGLPWADGSRPVCQPLAWELRRQRNRFAGPHVAPAWASGLDAHAQAHGD
ncbi:beta-glucosidase [Bordetella genomosp. 13]|uniref:beta-glucosidase n=1 Tax=Bordetella genomosp. 13 TaxID=463040 RepID=UPI0011A29FF2|nr:beta-glucosidase [Bordetella genomosp. 13]